MSRHDNKIYTRDLSGGFASSQASEMGGYMVKGLSKLYSAQVARAKIVAATVGGILVLFMSIFLMGTVMTKESKMVINCAEGDGSLSLSETVEGFNSDGGTVRLEAEGIPKITNISRYEVSDDIHNEKDGSHNGQNYFAYTFYLKNVGTASLNYSMELRIVMNTKNMGDAMRVEVFSTPLFGARRETSYYKYAKAKEDGSAELFDENDPSQGYCTNFENDKIISSTTYTLPVQQIYKYTLLMYIDGPDEDCTDTILNGSFGFEVLFVKR